VTLSRENVRDFIIAISDGGASPATCSVRHRALHRFGAWLADEGELDYNPLWGMSPPKRETKGCPEQVGDRGDQRDGDGCGGDDGGGGQQGAAAARVQVGVARPAARAGHCFRAFMNDTRECS
jgi:hypothetical protein